MFNNMNLYVLEIPVKKEKTFAGSLEKHMS